MSRGLSATIAFRLSHADQERLARLAEQQGTDVSKLARSLLRQAIGAEAPNVGSTTATPWGRRYEDANKRYEARPVHSARAGGLPGEINPL